MRLFLKRYLRTLIRSTHSDFVYRINDALYFRRLKRRPPELIWQPLARGPECRLDAGGVVIGDRLYVIGGYANDSFHVIKSIDVFDLAREKWVRRIPMPAGMGQTHLGAVGDGCRYIYIVAGQDGIECHPAVRACFVFDAREESFHSLPPLPAARYAPTAQLWNGRLHIIGGSREDRTTPGCEHWSLAVNKKGTDSSVPPDGTWQEEIPIPRGGPHRASAILGDDLYVFGGQEGDVVAIPGHPGYHCTTDLTCETMHREVYCLKRGARVWERKADMLLPVSHIEFSIVPWADGVLILGGQIDKHSQTKKISVTDLIQYYDAAADSWHKFGRLPYPSKTVVVACQGKDLFITTGQKSDAPDDPHPRAFDNRTWKAKRGQTPLSPD